MGSRPGGCGGAGSSGLRRRTAIVVGFSVSSSSSSPACRMVRPPPGPVAQGVGDVGVVGVDGDPEIAPPQPEPKSRNAIGQLGIQGQDALVVAQATETVDQRHPGAGQRRHVQPVAGVAVQVAQVDQRGLVRVVMGQLQMPDLGAHHRLSARRQRRVAHHAPLVVVDVARLLLGCERVALPLHRQHQVGLLDHLRGVEPHIGLVQEQRIGLVGVKFPLREGGEAFALLMDTQLFVVGNVDRRGRVAPGRGLLGA